MVFHDCSGYVKDWLIKQPCVKEESLTDWLLFNTSTHNSAIYYQTFSRREEAFNGSDWEWWILTTDSSSPTKSSTYNAYRFFVQAKKLLSNGQDNYSNLSYSNKNGLQIDLLIQKASSYNAFPLYMYYSTTEPEIKEQEKNSHFVNKSDLDWCSSCLNGCFLANAYDVYKLLFANGRNKMCDIELLNHSCKLSLLDRLFTYSPNDAEFLLSKFNNKIIEYVNAINDHSNRFPYYFDGIKHSGNKIPNYLSLFIEHRKEDLTWFEAEMQHTLPDVSGIGVIDLRYEH